MKKLKNKNVQTKNKTKNVVGHFLKCNKRIIEFHDGIGLAEVILILFNHRN